MKNKKRKLKKPRSQVLLGMILYIKKITMKDRRFRRVKDKKNNLILNNDE